MIVRATGAFFLTLFAIGFFHGDFYSSRDILISFGLAALVGVAVALWLRWGDRRETAAAGVFDERMTRRAVRRGVVRTALVAVVWVVTAAIVLQFASIAWQSRGDRRDHFAEVAAYGFAASHPGFRASYSGCCNTYLRTTELRLDVEPRVAGPLSQSITVKLKLNLNGRLKDPWSLKLPRTGVDAAVSSGPPTKAELRKVLGRMPRSVVTTAVVDLKSPTGIGPFHELLARHRLDRGGIPVFLEPDLRSMVDLRDRGGGIGTRVSWPDASVAQFQAWVKKLRGNDERLLADLGLPPRRVLRKLADEPRIYAFVLDQASGQRLAGLLSDPAVRSIELGDAAFDLRAAS